MKFVHKLIVGFSVFVLSIWYLGYFAYTTSQMALQKTIVNESTLLAQETLDKIDRLIFYRINEFQIYTADIILQRSLMELNKNFGKINDLKDYIDKKDREWISVPEKEITPFMQELMNNELSEEIKEKIEYHEKHEGFKVFDKVLVTNRYGANVALTDKFPGYRHDDEEWWQKTKKNGLHVENVKYDKSTGMYSIDFAVRADDKDGNFLGVMKVVFNIEEVIDIIKKSSEDAQPGGRNSINSKLINGDSRLLYSTRDFSVFEDVSHLLEGPFREEPNHMFFHVHEDDSPSQEAGLIVHAHSKGFRDYKGLGWIYLLEYEKSEILAPVIRLKKGILLTSLGITVFALLISISASRSITRSLKKLRHASAEVGRGNLDTYLDIVSKDEYGQFAMAFNRMVSDIRASRDILAREVAARSDAENNLKKTAENLKRSNAELQQFAFFTSHHLQEPLRTVTSYVQLLQQRYKGKLDADADEFIKYAVDGTKNMKELILDFHSYSQLDTLDKKIKPVESEIVMEKALANLQTAIEENNAVVTRDSLPKVIGEETQLVRLFQNLISNAIKFRGDGTPRIHVSSEQRDDEWLFSVSDNGIGIEPEYSERIFGLFQRLHSNNKYRGTGIGLSVCKKIVERHGGNIWVESDKGKGSIFKFTISNTGG